MKISIYKKTINAVIVALLCVAMLSSFGMPASAQSSTAQSEQIKTLLALIQQLQAQLAQIQGGSSNTGQCIQLSRALFLGVSDSETSGEVSKLQDFLTKTGHYTYGKSTGYFGPATQTAVQAWQKTNGVVSSGAPETTGYGVTGPSTRSAMAKACSSVSTKPITVPVTEEEVVPKTSLSNSGTISSDATTYLLSPRLNGTAKNVDAVRISYQSESADYAGGYISNPIPVVGGKWSHTVTHTSKPGVYKITLLDSFYTKVGSNYEITTTDEEKAVLDKETLTIYSNPSILNFELDFNGNTGGNGYFTWQANNASDCDVYQTHPNGDKDFIAKSKDPDMGSYESIIDIKMSGELQYTLKCYGYEAEDGTQPTVEKSIRNIGYKG